MELSRKSHAIELSLFMWRQCQMAPLKMWLHTAWGCNHQSFECPSSNYVGSIGSNIQNYIFLILKYRTYFWFSLEILVSHSLSLFISSLFSAPDITGSCSSTAWSTSSVTLSWSASYGTASYEVSVEWGCHWHADIKYLQSNQVIPRTELLLPCPTIRITQQQYVRSLRELCQWLHKYVWFNSSSFLLLSTNTWPYT